VSLRLERSGPWIGVGGMFVMLWLVITTVFLYAPWWGFLIHLVALVSFVPLLRSWARTRPARCIWVPVFALAAWCVINAVGIFLLDWRFHA
jgi:hypothetical protein